MQTRKTLLIIILMLFFFSAGYAQNAEMNMDTAMFFPNEYLLDTINAFGQEKDSNYYERMEKSAIFTNNWYSKKLILLDEPKLYNKSNHESYRFTWFGYLGVSHNPLSVRIENHDGNIFLIAKYFHRKLGFKEEIDGRFFNNKLWGYGTKREYDEKVIIHDTIFLGQKEWKIFKDKLESVDFWNVSPIEITEIVVFDGSTWIFEGNNGTLYHMVHRRVFTKSSEIGDICLYLLKLSKIPIKKK
jgi:hypothetical protein